jgi:membrane fusion protein, multidrug efflux system
MNAQRLLPLAVILLAACSKPETAKSDSTATAAPVVLNAQDIALVESRVMGAAVLVSGNLDPAEMVSVKAQVPGTVTGVRVDRGSAVSRGQVLAVIEAQGIRSQAAGAEAQVAAARAHSRSRNNASRRRRSSSMPAPSRPSSTRRRKRTSKRQKRSLPAHARAPRERARVHRARPSLRPSVASSAHVPFAAVKR